VATAEDQLDHAARLRDLLTARPRFRSTQPVLKPVLGL
jgi:hypothetical protein